MRIGTVEEVRAIREQEELEIERMTLLEDIDEFEHRNGIRMHPDNPVLNPDIPRFAERKRQDIHELKNIGVRPCTPPRGDSVLDYYDLAPPTFDPLAVPGATVPRKSLTTIERSVATSAATSRATTRATTARTNVSGRSTASTIAGKRPVLPPLDLTPGNLIRSYRDVHVVTKRSLHDTARTSHVSSPHSTRSVSSKTSSRNLAGSYYLDPVFIKHRGKGESSKPLSAVPFKTATPRNRKDQDFGCFRPKEQKKEPAIEKRLKAEVARVIRRGEARAQLAKELREAEQAEMRAERRIALTSRKQRREALQAQLGQLPPRARPRPPDTPPAKIVDNYRIREEEEDIEAQRALMDLTHKKVKQAEQEAHYQRIREEEARARRRHAGSSRRAGSTGGHTSVAGSDARYRSALPSRNR